jgi:hypothetical protein
MAAQSCTSKKVALKTLAEIYGSGVFLAPKKFHSEGDWTAISAGGGDFSGGLLLSCAGKMPVLAHRSLLSPWGLAAMVDAGLSITAEVEEYGDEEEYLAAVRRRAGEGEVPAYYFPNPHGVLTDVAPLVDNTVHRLLNNKGAFGEYVDASLIPPRRVLRSPDVHTIRRLPLPVVLKVATDEPNGGGKGVLVCEKKRHLERAAKQFAGVSTLLAEHFLDAAENWAVQCAVARDGSVHIEGATRQVTGRSGIFAGNFKDRRQHPPDSVLDVAGAAAKAGARLGYRGICGFDLLVDRTGKAFLIDPNFRPTWSTPFLFHCDRLLVERGGDCARFVICRRPGGLDRFLACCRKNFDAGWLIPIATFDPHYGGLGNDNSLIVMMVIGRDRREIEMREKQLLRMGVAFTSMREAGLKATVPKLLNKLNRRLWRAR